MKENAKYKEIQHLYEYCQKIGVYSELEPLFDGYCLLVGRGDFVQHYGSYGCENHCVEPAIHSRLDYTAVDLKQAKRLVKYHKDRLNKSWNKAVTK